MLSFLIIFLLSEKKKPKNYLLLGRYPIVDKIVPLAGNITCNWSN